MKLTKLEEQGLRLAMTLARRGDQITLGEVAAVEGLSEALVAKVLGKLRLGGVVVAARGRHGGYELAVPPVELTVAAILRALGEPLLRGCFNGECLMSDGACPHNSGCGMRHVWSRINERITEVLERITLADLLKPEGYVTERMLRLIPDVVNR